MLFDYLNPSLSWDHSGNVNKQFPLQVARKAVENCQLPINPITDEEIEKVHQNDALAVISRSVIEEVVTSFLNLRNHGIMPLTTEEKIAGALMAFLPEPYNHLGVKALVDLGCGNLTIGQIVSKIAAALKEQP